MAAQLSFTKVALARLLRRWMARESDQSGAGAGIGSVFGSSIQAKVRQPELRQEIERDQWLGFALTEACFFYGLVGGFIAFFL